MNKHDKSSQYDTYQQPVKVIYNAQENRFEQQPFATETPVYSPALELSTKREKQPSRMRGRRLGSFVVLGTVMAGTYYGVDAATSYIKHQEVVSPLQAIEDVAKVPAGFRDMAEMVQLAINIGDVVGGDK